MAGRRMTLADRMARYLTEGQGMTERQPLWGGKWRWFTAPGGDSYFVGKAGAIRTGRLVSDSISLTDIIRPRMELWEREKGKME